MNFSIILEISILLTALVLIGISSLSDIRNSIIRNRTIVIFGTVILFLTLIYNLCFNLDLLPKYLINVFAMTCVSILLYHLKIWGGGDAKLMIVLVLCIPVRLYSDNISLIPLLEWPIYIFSIGYIYILIESVFLFINNKAATHFITKEEILSFLKSYLFLSVYMTLLSGLFQYAVPSFYEDNILLFWLLSSIISLLICDHRLFINVLVITAAVILDLIMLWKGKFEGISLMPYLIILALFVLKAFISVYNYQTIKIAELKTGMVLSANSTMQFVNAKGANLPMDISETLSAKLSNDNIIAINKWYAKHSETDEITIVRKIPFAIFVGLGFIYYIVMGVLR